ncbi:hypothetical protein [Corallococcus carmarthensis]|uniref:Uncharacterized protein n=1 Tax=Corallococcus carmarthensis TaxID=2316728 RepID=A0A3A8KJ79_9BACT|nr:hypothetical protein [Corallococcus carmarthensis]NOK17172.1 hypothetical protein [Corallococcus carmarthensis]RKH01974.1 hypothetical protein D7X32_18470 [Corallococcus carmarthensis]
MHPSTEQLLVIAKHYWPASVSDGDEPSPELARLFKRFDEALQDLGQWRGFLDHLRTLFPGFSIADGTGPTRCSFRCIVYPAKGSPLPPIPWAIMGCMSVLAPVFTVYGITFEYEGRKRRAAHLHLMPLPGAMQETARIVARELEARYHVSELPREVAATPVPVVVEWTQPPQTTLFDALFDSEPTNIP